MVKTMDVFTTGMPETREIPYHIIGEKANKIATIVPTEFSTDGLNQEELQVLHHIGNAVAGMTPIYSKQSGITNLVLFKELLDLEQRIEDPQQKAALADYNTLFAVRNGLFDLYGRKTKFSIPQSQLQSSEDVLIQHFFSELYKKLRPKKGRGFYPPDATKKEVKSRDKNGLNVNSHLIRNARGNLVERLNEKTYRNELKPVIDELQKAVNISGDINLKSYLSAKIVELKTGIKESIHASDMAWLANKGGNIDFVLSTGCETYLDELAGVRGAASAVVYVINQNYRPVAEKLLHLLPELEATAPWKHKKEVDPRNPPRLNFVDAFNWSGFYNLFPFILAAQSLPNEKAFQDKHGSVNNVFVNSAKIRSSGKLNLYIIDTFFPANEMSIYKDLIFPISPVMIGDHELGHTTGGTLIKKDPNEHFGEDFSIMEEARAELFSMWGMYVGKLKGIFTEEEEIASYYSMMVDILKSVALPAKDHNGSRNMMLYYFLKNGGVIERSGRYTVNPEKIRENVVDLLGTIGNIKALGDIKGLKKLMGEYISEKRMDYFQEKMKKCPYLGIGLIFPELHQVDGQFTGDLIYPATFREQRRSLNHFV